MEVGIGFLISVSMKQESYHLNSYSIFNLNNFESLQVLAEFSQFRFQVGKLNRKMILVTINSGGLIGSRFRCRKFSIVGVRCDLCYPISVIFVTLTSNANNKINQMINTKIIAAGIKYKCI